MLEIHGGSPSGLYAWLVEGRDLWPLDAVRSLLLLFEAARALFPFEEPGRCDPFEFGVEAFRPFGAALGGTRDFGGEFSSDDRM